MFIEWNLNQKEKPHLSWKYPQSVSWHIQYSELRAFWQALLNKTTLSSLLSSPIKSTKYHNFSKWIYWTDNLKVTTYVQIAEPVVGWAATTTWSQLLQAHSISLPTQPNKCRALPTNPFILFSPLVLNFMKCVLGRGWGYQGKSLYREAPPRVLNPDPI